MSINILLETATQFETSYNAFIQSPILSEYRKFQNIFGNASEQVDRLESIFTTAMRLKIVSQDKPPPGLQPARECASRARLELLRLQPEMNALNEKVIQDEQALLQVTQDMAKAGTLNSENMQDVISGVSSLAAQIITEQFSLQTNFLTCKL
ncbi:MAG: hypothetical protein P4L16_04040 [Chlamydiales bacterium]|nr:hypothetical protein [Chlamydiales bacterium]